MGDFFAVEWNIFLHGAVDKHVMLRSARISTSISPVLSLHTSFVLVPDDRDAQSAQNIFWMRLFVNYANNLTKDT